MKTDFGIIFMLLATTAFAFSCGEEETLPRDEPKPPKPPQDTEYYDVVENAGFDERIATTKWSLDQLWDAYTDDNAATGGWRYVGGWNDGHGEMVWSENEGVDGSPCLILRSKTKGQQVDLMVMQVVEGLDPSKSYRVSAKVKVKDVTGFGANISNGSGYCSRSDKGVTASATSSWQEVVYDIDHAPGGKALICLRLGYSGAASEGTVWFDDVTISDQSELHVYKGKYVQIAFPEKVLSVPTSAVNGWVDNLDKLYLGYKNLFSDRVPYGGKVIRVRAMEDFGAWAWAGNPVLWNTNYIAGELRAVARGHWSFGIMHELGHDFSNAIGRSMGLGNQSWNFNEELFANLRMNLAMIKVPEATVIETINGKEYVFKGEGISEKYKIYYDKTLGAGQEGSGGDGIHYTFCRIIDKYGFDLFKKTFNHLYQLPVNSGPVTGNAWAKFNFFLDELSRFAGEDVRSTYTQSDLNLIQKELDK